jgi:hypothetical protein
MANEDMIGEIGASLTTVLSIGEMLLSGIRWKTEFYSPSRVFRTFCIDNWCRRQDQAWTICGT